MKKIFAILLAAVMLLGGMAIAEEEDGQNPVMDLIGSYQDEVSQRASMMIEAGAGNTAEVTIVWANSAEECVKWIITGEYDTDANVINYAHCSKITEITAEDGSAAETVAYDNGTGKLIVNEDWSIAWQDDVEDAGKDCCFVYTPISADEYTWEEDGQNPVMNVIGDYLDETTQRVTLEITAGEGNTANVTINRPDSAEGNVKWVFTAEYDTDDNTLTYSDCLKIAEDIDAEGFAGEKVLYENGTGKLIVNEDWSISWQDNVEDAGKDCSFLFDLFAEEEYDGQNPIMNIVGSYTDKTGERAVMSIDPDGMAGGLVTIAWANSAEECVFWDFSGSLDPDALTLSYTDCVKTIITADENGDIVDETMVYADGTGMLTVNEDWSISWQDDVEDAGKDCVFCYDVIDEFGDFEDGQNPVMNLIGNYDAGNAYTMEIAAGEGSNAEVVIVCNDEENGTAIWTFTAEYNTDTNTLTYTDCKKIAEGNDEEADEDILYENGTGMLTVGDDWSITWQDDAEDAGNGLVFSYFPIDEF